MLLDILPPNRELLDPSGGNFPPRTDQEIAPGGDVIRKGIRRIYKRVPTPLCKAPSQTKLLSTFLLGRSDNNVGFAFILAVGLIGLDLILLAPDSISSVPLATEETSKFRILNVWCNTVIDAQMDLYSFKLNKNSSSY